jgi:hypothetical protein
MPVVMLLVVMMVHVSRWAWLLLGGRWRRRGQRLAVRKAVPRHWNAKIVPPSTLPGLMFLHMVRLVVPMVVLTFLLSPLLNNVLRSETLVPELAPRKLILVGRNRFTAALLLPPMVNVNRLLLRAGRPAMLFLLLLVLLGRRLRNKLVPHVRVRLETVHEHVLSVVSLRRPAAGVVVRLLGRRVVNHPRRQDASQRRHEVDVVDQALNPDSFAHSRPRQRRVQSLQGWVMGFGGEENGTSTTHG